MKNSGLNPYDKCLCGSGEKYKFCCYNKKNEDYYNCNDFYQKIKVKYKLPSFCMHQDNNCKGNPIKSHSIQKNKIISRLAVNNHVYMIDYKSKSKEEKLEFVLKGKNETSTSKSFCNHHDTMIFKLIEKSDYTQCEEENFLYAYRAFSKYFYAITAKKL